MVEKIEVNIQRKVIIEAVDGGLFFLNITDPDGTVSRKATTSGAALFKLLRETLDLKKQTRGPRKAKKER